MLNRAAKISQFGTAPYRVSELSRTQIQTIPASSVSAVSHKEKILNQQISVDLEILTMQRMQLMGMKEVYASISDRLINASENESDLFQAKQVLNYFTEVISEYTANNHAPYIWGKIKVEDNIIGLRLTEADTLSYKREISDGAARIINYVIGIEKRIVGLESSIGKLKQDIKRIEVQKKEEEERKARKYDREEAFKILVEYFEDGRILCEDELEEVYDMGAGLKLSLEKIIEVLENEVTLDRIPCAYVVGKEVDDIDSVYRMISPLESIFKGTKKQGMESVFEHWIRDLYGKYKKRIQEPSQKYLVDQDPTIVDRNITQKIRIAAAQQAAV